MKEGCRQLVDLLLAEHSQKKLGNEWFADFFAEFHNRFDCGLTEFYCDHHIECKTRIKEHYLRIQQ